MIVALKAYEIKTFCLYAIVYQNFIFLYRGREIAIFVSGDLEYAIFIYGRRLENAVFCMWGYWKVHFWYVVVSKMPLFGMWGLQNVFF